MEELRPPAEVGSDSDSQRPSGQPRTRRERARAAYGRVREPVRHFVTLRWVPLTAALVSLVLSVTAIYVSTRQPDVLLIMPDVIRVAQGRESGSAYVYLQPAFVSTGSNDRVEVIRDMTLEAKTVTNEVTPLTWDQQLRLVSDPQSGGLSYEYVADAVPLLVGPREAAAPLSLFDAPDGWFFAPGTYRLTLIADRVVVGQPLRAEFTLSLTDADVAFLEQPGGDRFLTFPIE